MNKNECTHMEHVSGRWEENPHYDPAYLEDDCGEESHAWIEDFEERTTVDVDLHRYKCTQCGEMFYYSQAARDFYENGVKCDIPGLGG